MGIPREQRCSRLRRLITALKKLRLSMHVLMKSLVSSRIAAQGLRAQ
jgi:hypothetical protein